MRRHLVAALAGVTGVAWVGFLYYAYTQTGWPPIEGLRFYMTFMAVTLGAYFWYYWYKHYDRFRRRE